MDIAEHHQILSHKIYNYMDEAQMHEFINIYREVSGRFIFILYNAIMGFIPAIEKEVFIEIEHKS